MPGWFKDQFEKDASEIEEALRSALAWAYATDSKEFLAAWDILKRYNERTFGQPPDSGIVKPDDYYGWLHLATNLKLKLNQALNSSASNLKTELSSAIEEFRKARGRPPDIRRPAKRDGNIHSAKTSDSESPTQTRTTNLTAEAILEWLASQLGDSVSGIPGGAALLSERPDICTPHGKDILRILDDDACIEAQVFSAIRGVNGYSPWFSPTRQSDEWQSWDQIVDRAILIIHGLGANHGEIEVDGKKFTFSGKGLLLTFAPRLRITEHGKTVLARSKFDSESAGDDQGRTSMQKTDAPSVDHVKRLKDKSFGYQPIAWLVIGALFITAVGQVFDAWDKIARVLWPHRSGPTTAAGHDHSGGSLEQLSTAPAKPGAPTNSEQAIRPTTQAAANPIAAQRLPNDGPEKSTHAALAQAPADTHADCVPEKSAAEVLSNILQIKENIFKKRSQYVSDIYKGRCISKPGWLARVIDMPSKTMFWFVPLKESTSGALIQLMTEDDAAKDLRVGQDILVSGLIYEIPVPYNTIWVKGSFATTR